MIAPSGTRLNSRGELTRSDCTAYQDKNSSFRETLTWTAAGVIEKIENFNSNNSCLGDCDSELTYNASLVLHIAGASSGTATSLDASNDRNLSSE